MTSLAFAILMFLLAPPARAGGVSAVVDGCAVSVWFPVENPGATLRWRRKETAENNQEFARLVTVLLGPTERYQWGLTLWKQAGTREESGTLAGLLSAAQLNFWNLRWNGADFDPAHAYLRATVENDGASILIRMSDPEVLGAVLKKRPKIFSLEFFDPEHGASYGPVAPRYEDDKDCSAPGFV